MANPQTLNIAILDTDIPVPVVLNTRGPYSSIFQQLLEAALIRLSTYGYFANQPFPKIQWTAYNVVRGQYPSDISALDAVVISGSASSVYDADPWIATLHTWLRSAYTAHPRLKFFGSCFGHQILCSALLPSSSSTIPQETVTKNPFGWELGIHTVALAPSFLRAFPVDITALPSSPVKKTITTTNTTAENAEGNTTDDARAPMRLQFVHADHVAIVPDARPRDGERWHLLGSTPRCAVQGVYATTTTTTGHGTTAGRVLTLQGHFEFDAFVNGETIKVFGAGWGAEALARALAEVDAGEDDARWAAEVVAAFLVGVGEGRGQAGGVVVGAGGAVVEGGLMTPPGEA
ncbi:class I glutamine amidotransferase-like protein [Macrophomina phaseolina]|uniref:Class I glutamine amidotransferase-like protein n=1 Tax=Macrophomina phaseolina TaxID=35725 RepID=A0ABQ8GIW1_9PEZI|nr:class I glutamine amidotransferase-like protein [Macrophomina phaseolina]